LERRKTNRLSALLLAAGLGCAAAIHFLAPEPVDDPLLNDPRAERKYHRELAMYGGKANVVSAEFMDWFGGLWHGRALGGTVAVLTVAGVLVFRFAALPPATPRD
jgi:multisubunit Na+/H+ antiporter MnhB subunit